MLLSQTFKTGSVAAVGVGRSRNQNALAGTTLSVRRRIMSKPVSASSASGGESQASPGWLESNLGKVTSYVDKKLHGDGKSAAPEEMVEMKGTAIVVKKLKALDLVDRMADFKDDLSEVVQGKHVYVQLMSGEIDSST